MELIFNSDFLVWYENKSFNKSFTGDDAFLKIKSSDASFEDESGEPDIAIEITLENKKKEQVSFYIETPQQIDALRLFCEMTLAHHKNAIAEFHRNAKT